MYARTAPSAAAQLIWLMYMLRWRSRSKKPLAPRPSGSLYRPPGCRATGP